MPLPLTVMDVGRMEYGKALDLQFDLLAQREAEKIGDTLILVEHPPVITMGKSGRDTDILADSQTLAKLGVDVFRINRGGEVTYHGPGQIVGYLIINLYNHQRKLKRFVETLEELFIQMLATEYGIEARHDPEHRGVWVGDEKITAVGIAVKRSITMHGFAFNVNTNLDHFRWIVPCGIRDRGPTSLERILGHRVPMDEAKRKLVRHFCALFGYETPEDYR
ncbi:lipoyl(octanoyl) transferase LipB [Salinispira pacifica]